MTALLFSGLKGRNMKARGNAPGKDFHPSPEP
jgi:hypothetical protein